MLSSAESSPSHGPPGSILFNEFSITRNGFLPDRAPLKRLNDPYYDPWETVLDHLPSLLKQKSLRNTIDGLPMLSTKRLHTEEEWRRAYVILSFLSHSYVWGGDNASEVLPPVISAPYLQISELLDLPPVATYSALNLWNFTTTTGNFGDLDSIEALHTFSGTEDESWFFSVSVAMEAEGAYIIPVILRALEAIEYCDYSTTIEGLDEMTMCIGKLARLLNRMYEKCDPMVFYHQIRPYLAGSKNMAAAGLPNGVLYEDWNGTKTWKQLRGGSNGQSSLIQLFDIVLGVEHAIVGGSSQTKSTLSSDGSKTAPTFHEEVRSYMPAGHSAFLQHISQTCNLRKHVDTSATSDEQGRLKRSFQAATKALGDFRNKHMQMVTRYIIIPSRRQSHVPSVNLATSSQANQRQGELTGTGGTALIPFLRQTRDETYMTGTFPSGIKATLK
ncbi:indoleamine 2,3-dioxygenase [Whalleya microplaca]|nr:indoleamine 2,3-dioxygenase [Whalleya microplaca]